MDCPVINSDFRQVSDPPAADRIPGVIFLLFIFISVTEAQTVSTGLPKDINPKERYLFYLHGAVVTILGNNAINNGAPEWGPYEYLNILDSLAKNGFTVISENRKEKIDDTVYSNKIVKQIDSLFKKQVSPESILLIGASAGWNIVLQVAYKMKHKSMRFVIMGGCWPDTYKDFSGFQLNGNFLSVIEASDPHGTCIAIFESRNTMTSYKEIKLNTGLSHGFFYKGRRAWIDPIMQWFNELPHSQP